MVKNKQKIGIVVYHDDFNSVEFLAKVLVKALGYHYTQALSCAQIITSKKEYLVKAYTTDKEDIAKTVLELITEQGVPARLIPL